MPFFEESGRIYKEQLEASYTTVRLVTGSQQVVDSMTDVATAPRTIAAARATFEPTNIPSAHWKTWSDAEIAFLGRGAG